MTDNKQIKYNRITHDKIACKYNQKHDEIYNDIEQHRLNNIIKDIISRTKLKSIQVLDFGAGTGNLTKKFINFGCQVTACDVSEKSLNILSQESNSPNLKVKPYNGQTLPFPDNSFDIVSTYSVLHHIPDYLSAIEEMVRVTKKNGLVYIDHETNNNHWHPNPVLNEYYQLIKKTFWEKLSSSLKSGELFSWNFVKGLFIKNFINKRYQAEGDIHVWPDDHIEWNDIVDILQNHCKIIEQVDYLLYYPKINKNIYHQYQNRCNDTRLILAKKV
ncbi:class I SAM-dependent methyltransferase [Patescibacteria group bacterium]